MDSAACPYWYSSLDTGWNPATGFSQQTESFRGTEVAVGHNHNTVNALLWFIPVFAVSSSNYKSGVVIAWESLR